MRRPQPINQLLQESGHETGHVKSTPWTPSWTFSWGAPAGLKQTRGGGATRGVKFRGSRALRLSERDRLYGEDNVNAMQLHGHFSGRVSTAFRVEL